MPSSSAESAAKIEPPLIPTLRRFLPYLWPAGAAELKARIVVAMLFVLGSKLLQVFVVAYALKVAVDTMAGGDRSQGWFVVAVVAPAEPPVPAALWSCPCPLMPPAPPWC